MTSIIAARKILSNAANKANPALTEAENTKLQEHIKMASVAWEKCIAATAVHYVNDLFDDMDEYKSGKPATLSNFETVAKHECNIERFVDENLFLGIAVDQSDPLSIGREASG